MRKYSRGDLVIYDEIVPPRTTGDTRDEHSADIVQHFMTVCESRKRGTVVLQMQNGKMHVTLNTNPCLRRAHWWERVLYRDCFPRLDLIDRR